MSGRVGRPSHLPKGTHGGHLRPVFPVGDGNCTEGPWCPRDPKGRVVHCGTVRNSGGRMAKDYE